MEAIQSLVKIVIVGIYIVIVLKPVQLLGHTYTIENYGMPNPAADKRMLKPPTFPYGAPYGYSSSGLLCIFNDVPYLGGWFGRGCAGPVRPFTIPHPPSPPSTTQASTPTRPEMSMGPGINYGPYQNNYNSGSTILNDNPDPDPNDYGDPVEGSPWDEDPESLFIETYGVSASKPGFRLGDPNKKY